MRIHQIQTNKLISIIEMKQKIKNYYNKSSSSLYHNITLFLFTKESIMINLGQCGIQIGESALELFCKEHNIDLDGKSTKSEGYTAALFDETSSGDFVPRSVFADTETMCLDQLKVGPLKNLLNFDGFIQGNGESSNNYCRGHYTIGKELIEESMEKIRKLAEGCSTLSCFLFVHSILGGMGSGVSSLLSEHLSVNFGKVSKIGFLEFPSPNIYNSVMEIYNSMLSVHNFIEHTDLAIMFNNEALYDIYQRAGKSDVKYKDINQLLSYSLSSTTMNMRFDNIFKNSYKGIITNLVPYPRIHFTSMSYAPCTTSLRRMEIPYTTSNLSSQLLSSESSQLKYNIKSGKPISYNINFQGPDIDLPLLSSSLETWKNESSKFVNFSPTGINIDVNKKAPTYMPSWNFSQVGMSAFGIFHTTEVTDVFKNMTKKFDKMYAKRAFVHWLVGEGASEGEIPECREDLAALINDYDELNQKKLSLYQYP